MALRRVTRKRGGWVDKPAPKSSRQRPADRQVPVAPRNVPPADGRMRYQLRSLALDIIVFRYDLEMVRRAVLERHGLELDEREVSALCAEARAMQMEERAASANYEHANAV